MRSSIFDNLFVLEMANNHWGDVERGLKIIADYGKVVRYNNVRAAMKFQFRDVEQFIHKDFRHRTDIRYIKKTLDTQLSWADYQKLVTAVRNTSMISMATPFDEVSVDKCVELGIQIIKIASSDIKDWFLIEKIATTKKPVIISTGMANLADVQEAVDAVRGAGNHDIILLHCVALYPTPVEQVNLRSMQTLRSAFGLPTGYSDHTLGFSAVIAAVAMGACVIEKHFTLNRGLEGPDHKFALEPLELKEMVRAIRDTEAMLGHPEKRPSPGEEAKLPLSHRSIIAAVDIAQGTVIERDMLVTKRPGLGIPPKFIDVVVGRRAVAAITKDTPLQWEMI